MKELSKKHNITVKFEDLPKTILGIYIEVLEQPYIILNEILHSEMHKFMFYACMFFKNEGLGKITIADLEKKDFMPFIYAREQMGNEIND